MTDWRGRKQWLADTKQNPQQNTVLEWSVNRQAAFKVKGRRPPKFKHCRKALPTLPYTRNGFSINEDGRLVLAGGITIPVVWHRELPAAPSSVRVFRDPVGYWWASFVVQRSIETFPVPTNPGVGVDWGVKQTATTTNPEYDLPHAEHGKTAARRLARYQRMMARRATPRNQANTKGYDRAKTKAAKAHAKVARQRRHDAIQWSRRMVTDHELIGVEDFKPKFLAKSTMARKAADARIGATKVALIEYAERAARRLVLVAPAYTTMTCSECGVRAKHRLELSQRIFRCWSCGFTADRDWNAARVILVTAESAGVSVESIRR